jgi:uncharacterized protein (TIGR00251 family)
MKKYLEKQSGNSFLLQIHVKPNSKKQDIIIDGDTLTIKVQAKALQNKANKELLNLLKTKLHISSNQLNIASGVKSKDKVIQISFLTEINEEEVKKKLLT